MNTAASLSFIQNTSTLRAAVPSQESVTAYITSNDAMLQAGESADHRVCVSLGLSLSKLSTPVDNIFHHKYIEPAHESKSQCLPETISVYYSFLHLERLNNAVVRACTVAGGHMGTSKRH